MAISQRQTLAVVTHLEQLLGPAMQQTRLGISRGDDGIITGPVNLDPQPHPAVGRRIQRPQWDGRVIARQMSCRADRQQELGHGLIVA